MLNVFMDASFLIARIDPRDQHRPNAIVAMASLRNPVLHTTEEVLYEVLAFFSKRGRLRFAAIAAIEDLLGDNFVIVHPQSHESFLSALALYRGRPDKGYSLCDCRSMVLMDELGITNVLTNDVHFSQAGYKPLY